MIECLSIIHKVLGSIPGTKKGEAPRNLIVFLNKEKNSPPVAHDWLKICLRILTVHLDTMKTVLY